MTIQPRWYESNLMIGALLLVLGGLVLCSNMNRNKDQERCQTAQGVLLKLGGRVKEEEVQDRSETRRFFRVSYGIPREKSRTPWTEKEALDFARAAAAIPTEYLTIAGDAIRPNFVRSLARENQSTHMIEFGINGPFDPKNFSVDEIECPMKIVLRDGAATDELIVQLFENPKVKALQVGSHDFRNIKLPQHTSVTDFCMFYCDTTQLFTDEFLRDWSKINSASLLECKVEKEDFIQLIESSDRPRYLSLSDVEIMSSGQPLSLQEAQEFYCRVGSWIAYGTPEEREDVYDALCSVANPEKYTTKKTTINLGNSDPTSTKDLIVTLKLSTQPGVKLSAEEYENLEKLFPPLSNVLITDCEVEEQTIAPND